MTAATVPDQAPGAAVPGTSTLALAPQPSVPRQFGVLAARNLRQALTGRAIALMVAFPLLFFVGFLVVFRELMAARGIDYEQFLPPAIVVQAGLLVAMSACFMLAGDTSSGLLNRYRSMPMHAAVVASARLAVDAVRASVATVVIVLAAFVAGFRFHGSAFATVAFFAVAVGFAVVLATGCTALALRSKEPEHVYAMLTLPYLLALTISTANVPVGEFPGWLQPVVRVSPVTAVIDLLRALSTGTTAAAQLWPALAWMGGLSALFGFAAIRAFRRTR
jgi:ABC-2 type transport system permease protein